MNKELYDFGEDLGIAMSAASKSMEQAINALVFYATATIPEFSNDVSYQLIDGANRIRTGRKAREALEEIRVHATTLKTLEEKLKGIAKEK